MSSSEDEPPPKRTKKEPSSESKTENVLPINPSYAKEYLRVSKANLYMIIALCMEDFVNEPIEDYRRVAAVLVLPDDVVCAIDCSRDGVHAVQRLLMRHYDKAEGSKMFMTRKPCPMCAKLLVQAKVKRVLFLPREPEYYLSPIPLEENADKKTREEVQSENDKRKESNETKMKQVDSLFTASSIAQTRFVLQVEKAVLTDAETKSSKKNTDAITVEITVETKKLIAEYEFDSEWMDCIEKELPWPAFDKEIQAEVMSYFENAMKWMARAKVLQGRGLKYEFERYSETSKGSRSFNPVDNSIHAEQACHFLTIARFLAERTDDPKTGVGAVIVQFPEMEIISLGWNGFPLKALYGEFPRASKSDESKDDKKYPYVVHAEQNALLFRNRKKIDDEAILFVTKSPCNECTPLIAMHPGIKTVVVDDDVSSRDDKAKNIGLGYKKFPDMVEKGRFFCFQTKALEEPKTDDQKKASRKLRFHEK